MAYALKIGAKVVPLTGLIDPNILLQAEGSTIVYEDNAALKAEIGRLFSSSNSPSSSAVKLQQLLCCLPLIPTPPKITYENVFRVLIIQFLDAWNFDVRSVKKAASTSSIPTDASFRSIRTIFFIATAKSSA